MKKRDKRRQRQSRFERLLKRSLGTWQDATQARTLFIPARLLLSSRSSSSQCVNKKDQIRN